MRLFTASSHYIPPFTNQVEASTSAASITASTSGELMGGFFLISTESSPPLYNQESASAVYNPHRQEYLVVWYNARSVYLDTQAQRVRKDGKLVDGPFCIAGGPGEQRSNPDVAYNTKQQEYLIVWESRPDISYAKIHMQRVGPTGSLNGNAMILGTGPETPKCYTPAVAYAYTFDSYSSVGVRATYCC